MPKIKVSLRRKRRQRNFPILALYLRAWYFNDGRRSVTIEVKREAEKRPPNIFD